MELFLHCMAWGMPWYSISDWATCWTTDEPAFDTRQDGNSNFLHQVPQIFSPVTMRMQIAVEDLTCIEDRDFCILADRQLETW